MKEATLIFDLVCGQVVDTDSVKHRCEHEGECYYFCSEQCWSVIEQSPGRYLKALSYGPYH